MLRLLCLSPPWRLHCKFNGEFFSIALHTFKIMNISCYMRILSFPTTCVSGAAWGPGSKASDVWLGCMTVSISRWLCEGGDDWAQRCLGYSKQVNNKAVLSCVQGTAALLVLACFVIGLLHGPRSGKQFVQVSVVALPLLTSVFSSQLSVRYSSCPSQKLVVVYRVGSQDRTSQERVAILSLSLISRSMV